MYVRSHIDTVSGDRKYIYIDENNKKYIRDKNKYYPIKKYKGVYTLQKIRGGAMGVNIDVELLVYDIKDVDGKVSKEAKKFDTTIDLSNIVLNPNDEKYKEIIKDNKIYIFNKGSESIEKLLSTLNVDIININHYVIIKIGDNVFKVIYKKIIKYTLRSMANINDKYNIIYIRNNKIDEKSTDNLEENFLTIFSITDVDDVNDVNVSQSYDDYTVLAGTLGTVGTAGTADTAELRAIEKKEKEEYNRLYHYTLNKLKEIYR
uniref:Uncharacterized protein n=1 Tax=viral metagenome TaxID=1070528 RepID=A0A6C0L9K7_9ZZZZ